MPAYVFLRAVVITHQTQQFIYPIRVPVSSSPGCYTIYGYVSVPAGPVWVCMEQIICVRWFSHGKKLPTGCQRRGKALGPRGVSQHFHSHQILSLPARHVQRVEPFWRRSHRFFTSISWEVRVCSARRGWMDWAEARDERAESLDDHIICVKRARIVSSLF